MQLDNEKDSKGRPPILSTRDLNREKQKNIKMRAMLEKAKEAAKKKDIEEANQKVIEEAKEEAKNE